MQENVVVIIEPFYMFHTQSKPLGVACAWWRLCVHRLSLRLMHTPPMRVFELGFELRTACGWVSAIVSNVTRTHAVGVSWGLSKPLQFVLDGKKIWC